MTRVLAIALLLVILWLAVDNLSQRFKELMSGPSKSRRSVPRPAQTIETLVSCAACGTYIPSSRALKAAAGGTEVFCSEECRGKV